MNLNDIVGGLKQMNSPVARNAIEKFTKGDIKGVNQIAENLMQANANTIAFVYPEAGTQSAADVIVQRVS